MSSSSPPDGSFSDFASPDSLEEPFAVSTIHIADDDEASQWFLVGFGVAGSRKKALKTFCLCSLQGVVSTDFLRFDGVVKISLKLTSLSASSFSTSSTDCSSSSGTSSSSSSPSDALSGSSSPSAGSGSCGLSGHTMVFSGSDGSNGLG